MECLSKICNTGKKYERSSEAIYLVYYEEVETWEEPFRTDKHKGCRAKTMDKALAFHAFDLDLIPITPYVLPNHQRNPRAQTHE